MSDHPGVSTSRLPHIRKKVQGRDTGDCTLQTHPANQHQLSQKGAVPSLHLFYFYLTSLATSEFIAQTESLDHGAVALDIDGTEIV